MEYVLYENINGYYLFLLNQQEKINDSKSAETYENLGKLSQIIQLQSKYFFININEAYENYKSLNKNILPDKLIAFLNINNIKILHCDKSLFINLNNFGIRTKYSPFILKGIKANEDKILLNEINKKFILAANKLISYKTSNYGFKNETYLINQYYISLILQTTELNKIFQSIKKLFEIYFPEFKEKKQLEFIKILKILKNFKNDNLIILKEKSLKINIPINILQESLGNEIDWNLINKQIEIFDSQLIKIKTTEKVLEDKIIKIFPFSIKLMGFKSLASLLSKIGYDNIPLLNIEKYKKLCPPPEKIIKKERKKYFNFYYSISLKMLRLEYYGALTNELTNNFIKNINQRYKKNRYVGKIIKNDLENRILEKLKEIKE